MQEVLMGGRPMYFAHTSAVISEQAAIGHAAKIHPNALIQGEANIGSDCIVGPGAHINDGTLYPGAAVWNYSSVRPGAEIGRGASVGQFCVVNTDVSVGEYSRIQNHVSIPDGVIIGSSVFVGPGAKFPNDRHPRAFGPWTAGETEIGFGASIGANATVVCGEEGSPTQVAPFVTLAAGSVATKSLTRPFGLYVGNKQVGWVDMFGRTISHDVEEVPTFSQVSEGLEEGLAADERLSDAQVAIIRRRVVSAHGTLAA
jgi:UDP-2-acetamido-3-amino-2,3-dideoxy-glucuronate N-acetyltransferase